MAAPVRLRLVALPTEHGGWAFLGAPILLGLAVAPSWAGGALALAAVAWFLSRHPLRLTIADLSRGKRYPRTGWAAGFALGYLAAAFGFLAFGVLQASAPVWGPLAVSFGLGLIAFGFDLAGRSRNLAIEVVGATALSPFAAAIVMAGGTAWAQAWPLSAVLALHAATAIFYVGERLRKGRGVTPRLVWAVGVHVVAAGLAGWVSSPWVVAAFGVLTLRCAWGLSARGAAAPAYRVGAQECGYTLLVVLAASLG